MALVPASTRSTAFTVASTSAGPFNIGFRLFDLDSLDVYVNGTRTTAFSITATFSDGYTDTGTITFTSALASGTQVIIDGALTPRREEDYINSNGLTENLNIELARIWSAVSEVKREGQRSLRGFAQVDAFAPTANRLLTHDGTKFISGPTVTEIAAIASASPSITQGGRITPHQFGTIYGDGVGNDTATIQLAIDTLSAAGGGTLWFPKGVYGVSSSGTTSLGRQVALLLKPNVILDGEGTIRRLGTNMAFDLIQGVGTGTFPDVTQTMGVRGLTLDGSSQNRVDGLAGSGGISGDGFNLWLFKVRNPVVENVTSLNSANWGVRVQQCIGGAGINNITTDHGPDVNADGVHFIDCRDLTGHGFNILTRGDDGFIVEANSFDNSNLHFTGINVRCPLTVNAAGRGVLVFRETGTNTSQLVMENIKIEAVTRNCGGPSNAGAGLAINTANTTMRNCVFDIQSDRCTRGATVFAGDATLPGVIENCVFRIVDSNSIFSPTQFGVATGIPGVFDGNRAEVMVFNPADGQTGVAVRGNKWTGHIIVDYNPNADKVSPGVGVSLVVTQSSLFVDCKGASRNLVVGDGSTANTIYLGSLRDAVVRDIDVAGTAVDTVFVGGSLTGAVLGATSATCFIGTNGAISGGTITGLSSPLPVASGGTAATTATAARTSLGVPGTPQSSAGIGQWTIVYAAPSTNVVLPAGGTWAWLLITRVTANSSIGGVNASVGAGGSTILAGAAGQDNFALAWRVA